MGNNNLINIGKEIVKFLKLPNSDRSHCFRRTTSTILADSGVTIGTNDGKFLF